MFKIVIIDRKKTHKSGGDQRVIQNMKEFVRAIRRIGKYACACACAGNGFLTTLYCFHVNFVMDCASIRLAQHYNLYVVVCV